MGVCLIFINTSIIAITDEGIKQYIDKAISVVRETFRIEIKWLLAEFKEEVSSSINGVSSNQGNDQNIYFSSNNVKDLSYGLHVINNVGDLFANGSNCEVNLEKKWRCT